MRIDEFKTRDDALAFARSTPRRAQPGQGQNATEAPAPARTAGRAASSRS